MPNPELLPPDPPRVFVGRETELGWLSREVNSQLRYDDWPIQVRGKGGIGKTALVAEFLSRERHGQDTLWVDCRDWSEGVPNYEGVIRSRGILERSSQRATLVLDGADEVSDRQLTELYERAINNQAIRSIVLTSRRMILGRRVQRELILVEFSVPEARELLQRETSLANFDENSLSQLDRNLMGHPLAISIVAAAARSMSSDQLRRFLEGKLFDLGDLTQDDRREVITAAKPIIISANQRIIEKLKKQPIDVFQLNSRQYEEIVAELLKDMGFEVELTPATRDGGVDILASFAAPTAKLLCLVEAKRYKQSRKVGVGLVRSLYGTLQHYQANSAMLVTTSTYSKDARALEEKHKFQLSLKDYVDVVAWIQEYGTRIVH